MEEWEASGDVLPAVTACRINQDGDSDSSITSQANLMSKWQMEGKHNGTHMWRIIGGDIDHPRCVWETRCLNRKLMNLTGVQQEEIMDIVMIKQWYNRSGMMNLSLAWETLGESMNLTESIVGIIVIIMRSTSTRDVKSPFFKKHSQWGNPALQNLAMMHSVPIEVSIWRILPAHPPQAQGGKVVGRQGHG